MVRADNLDRLTADGWAAAWDHGVRTAIDLRDGHERSRRAVRPAGIDLVHLPLDELAGEAWWQAWGHLDATPLSFTPYLEHCPQVCADVVRAVAHARPGGVVVHCGAGRDRTGLVALLLLALAGVGAAHVTADYELSAVNRPDDEAARQAILARAGTTVAEAVEATLAAFDPDRRLLAAGLTPHDLATARARLLE